MNDFQKINDTEERFNYINILSLLWNKKIFILFVTGIGTLLAVVLSFIITPVYESKSTILPEMEKSKLGPLGDLATLAGVNLSGDVIMVKLYPDIMMSETVLNKVLEKKYDSKLFDKPVDLYNFFEIKASSPRRVNELGLRLLRNSIKIDLGRNTGILSYSIATRDAKVSADILNTLTESLNDFLIRQRMTNAGEQRKWIAKRLEDVRRDLSVAEIALKTFKEKNRRVFDSPQLLMEQEQFTREIVVQTTIYQTLQQQYELARIEEIKSTPVINVLDIAKPAASKKSPIRRNIVIIGMLFSFCLSSIYLIISNLYIEKLKTFFKIITKDANVN